MPERKRCGAQIHHPNCDGWANSIDHFTPKCIGQAFGLEKKEVASEENLVPMNKLCHRLKDQSTTQRYQLLMKQKRGSSISLDDYRNMRNRYDLVFVTEGSSD
ncbi:MAG TPA: hypothetical protein VI819_05025 [Patescibacteria group bacterium]|nr:hypothetical protein [Patescibacteria group bacterium]